MSFLKSIDKYFPLFLLGSFAIGSTFHNQLIYFEGFVIYFVMIIVGLLYMKIDLVDVIMQMKNPFFLLYAVLCNLVIIPIITYYLFLPFGSTLSMGILLLASLPAGISSAVFTDIMRGRTCLSLILVVLTNLASVFTIPFIFLVFNSQGLHIQVPGLFEGMLQIFFIPFCIAEILKRSLSSKYSNEIIKLKAYYNLAILICVSIVIILTIASQFDNLYNRYLTSNIFSFTHDILVISLALVIFQILGYFSVFWRKKGEKVAVSNSSMIVNNILGVVLAISFFDEAIVSIIVLSFMPWSVMITAKHWYKKYLP